MPRSSRHKSHRQHRERSESEEDGDSRERRARVDEPEVASAKGRGSKDLEPERRTSGAKGLVSPGDGDYAAEHGRKRKDRVEELDRWNGGDEEDETDEKESNLEIVGTPKSKVVVVELVSRSSRKHEGSVERNEGGGGKRRSEKESSHRESSVQYKETKERDRERRENISQYKNEKDRDRDRERRSEEESSRRESNSQHKNVKERERDQRPEETSSRRESSSQYKDLKDRDRERRLERDTKKGPDGRYDKSDDSASRKHSNSKEEQKDMDTTEWQIRDDLRNPELEKELEKRLKRRDSTADKDKWFGDGREHDDWRIPSSDDRAKVGTYKSERHRDERYRDRHPGDLDKDQSHHDDKYRDEPSSRDHAGDRSDSKHYREESKVSDSNYKRIKLQDSDQDGSPYNDEHASEFKDRKGRKRSADENEDDIDFKTRSVKVSRGARERTMLGSSKPDSHVDLAYYSRPEREISSNRPKSSPSSSAYYAKDRNRHVSKPSESSLKGSPTGGRHRSGMSRDSETRPLEKNKPKDDIHFSELLHTPDVSQYDRTPRLDPHNSSVPSIERSPSTGDQRLSDRTGSSIGIEIEKVGSRVGGSKEGRARSTLEERGRECELSLEKSILDDYSRVVTHNSELPHVGQSSFHRSGHPARGSLSHFPPPPPGRLENGTPSVFGTSEDNGRVQSGDRRSNSRYKSSSDTTMGRAQGNTPWKGTPTWHSPAGNGFPPLQHGPPSTGFHPSIQQFPGQPLFNVRPSMDLNHSGVPYNIHDVTHVRAFGWRNPVDDSCAPHLQVWDGSNGVFPNESQVYGRSDWDHNRAMMGSRGWELGADIWKGHNGNMNMEFPISQKELEYPAHPLANEAWVRQSGNRLSAEPIQSERSPAEGIGSKRQNNTQPIKNSVDSPLKELPERTPEPSKLPNAPRSAKISNDKRMHFCCSYLSKLDISSDLTSPELYEQCMSLLEKRDKIGENKVPKHLCIQDTKKDNKVGTKNHNYILNALFPKVTNGIFERAIFLYKKHTERTKVETSMSAFPQHTKDPTAATPQENAPDGEGNETGSDQALNVGEIPPEEVPCGETENAGSDETSGDTLMANVDAGTDGDAIMKEKNNTPSLGEGILSDDAIEQPSSMIPDSFVSVEGSEPCEVLMQECMVNLNRIHNSPESTH